MIKFKVDKSSLRNLLLTFNSRNVTQEIRTAYYQIGLDIAGVKNTSTSGIIKKGMTTKSKSGRVYLVNRGIGGRRLSKPRRHVASAPNEFPAVITGNLRKSVAFKVEGSNRLQISMGGSEAPYAKFLEFGTSKMKARQPLRRGVISSKRNIKRHLENAIKTALK